MALENSSLPLKNALVHHYLPNRVLDRRWLLAIPFMVALVLFATLETASQARWQQWQSSPTIWDMLIGILANHHIVHHGLVNIFIYLVSGIGLTEQLETQLLLRIGSRKGWLKAQVICLLSYTVFYLSLILLSTLIVTLPLARFSWQWEGGFMQAYLAQQGLPAIWLQVSPVLTALFAIVLMGLAWLFMGLSAVLITILTQRPILGFLCGMILNYSTFIIAQTDALWLRKIWLSRYMFLWSNPVIADSIPVHFVVSCLYWIILNTIGLTALWVLAKKLNFTASRQAE
jgi:hypothetical protein